MKQKRKGEKRFQEFMKWDKNKKVVQVERKQ